MGKLLIGNFRAPTEDELIEDMTNILMTAGYTDKEQARKVAVKILNHGA